MMISASEKILFKAITGSRSFGTNIPTSDIDYKGVFIEPIDNIITLFNYRDEIRINKDESYFEISKFLKLLIEQSPNALELLYSPDDCILKIDPEFKLLIDNRHKFLTKKCRYSFGGYATQQIRKAVGLNKKMNWENERTERKSPIDFVYVYISGKTLLLKDWLEKNGLIQEKCGLVNLNHFRDCYSLYYDEKNFGYRGISFGDSNEVHLSNIPKGEHPIAIISYNRNAYSVHCREYKDYMNWLNNRNTSRYIETKKHDQKIDGKNLMHCRRLIDVAFEIAKEGFINVRRPNVDYLLSIRRGEIDLNKFIIEAEEDIKKIDEAFSNCNLPDEVDVNFANKLLLEIRHYNGK